MLSALFPFAVRGLQRVFTLGDGCFRRHPYGAFFWLNMSAFLTHFHLAENLWPEDFGGSLGLDRS